MVMSYKYNLNPRTMFALSLSLYLYPKLLISLYFKNEAFSHHTYIYYIYVCSTKEIPIGMFSTLHINRISICIYFYSKVYQYLYVYKVLYFINKFIVYNKIINIYE